MEQLVRTAERLAEQGLWNDEGIAVNLRILELDDTNAPAYTRLAKCFENEGRLLGALEMYGQALKFDPRNVIAKNGLQRVSEQVRVSDAVQQIRALEDFDEVRAIGVSAKQKGDDEIVIATFTRAVEVAPDKADEYLLCSLGGSCRRKERLKEAETAYRQAIKKLDSDIARNGLAAVFRDKGDLVEACELYLAVLRRRPQDEFALNGLIGLYKDTEAWTEEQRQAPTIKALRDLIRKELIDKGRYK